MTIISLLLTMWNIVVGPICRKTTGFGTRITHGGIGEFVWTGFDYLGEPTPYYTDWPSHSSLFGIIDLAGLPKDRYYLYRSHWNKDEETLHILPHWTWPGREGEVTPIFVYTNYPSAEVFINGKSRVSVPRI